MYLKNGNFPQLQRPLALKQELKKILQKIYIYISISFICHIGDLQTYWKLRNSSFRAGQLFTVYAQTGLNWFLLSLQTAQSIQ